MRELQILWVVALLALVGVLTGCADLSGTSVAGAAGTVTAAVLTPAQLAAVRQDCAAAGPALAVATSTAAPASVSGIAIYPAAYCAALASGAPPATTTSGTPSWLSGTLTNLQLAAQIAGFVLPLIGAL